MKAITAWAAEHDIPLVDLKAAVGEEVMSGRGTPTASTGTSKPTRPWRI